MLNDRDLSAFFISAIQSISNEDFAEFIKQINSFQTIFNSLDTDVLFEQELKKTQEVLEEEFKQEGDKEKIALLMEIERAERKDKLKEIERNLTSPTDELDRDWGQDIEGLAPFPIPPAELLQMAEEGKRQNKNKLDKFALLKSLINLDSKEIERLQNLCWVKNTVRFLTIVQDESTKELTDALSLFTQSIAVLINDDQDRNDPSIKLQDFARANCLYFHYKIKNNPTDARLLTRKFNYVARLLTKCFLILRSNPTIDLSVTIEAIIKLYKCSTRDNLDENFKKLSSHEIFKKYRDNLVQDTYSSDKQQINLSKIYIYSILLMNDDNPATAKGYLNEIKKFLSLNPDEIGVREATFKELLRFTVMSNDIFVLYRLAQLLIVEFEVKLSMAVQSIKTETDRDLVEKYFGDIFKTIYLCEKAKFEKTPNAVRSVPKELQDIKKIFEKIKLLDGDEIFKIEEKIKFLGNLEGYLIVGEKFFAFERMQDNYDRDHTIVKPVEGNNKSDNSDSSPRVGNSPFFQKLASIHQSTSSSSHLQKIPTFLIEKKENRESTQKEKQEEKKDKRKSMLDFGKSFITNIGSKKGDKKEKAKNLTWRGSDFNYGDSTSLQGKEKKTSWNSLSPEDLAEQKKNTSGTEYQQIPDFLRETGKDEEVEQGEERQNDAAAPK